MSNKKGTQTSEEEYFYRVNQELLKKSRAELDQVREEKEAKQRKALHWMKCPKCGGQMEEIELMMIKVDSCAECLGMYFDNGELLTLLESREPKGFLSRLKRYFN